MQLESLDSFLDLLTLHGDASITGEIQEVVGDGLLLVNPGLGSEVGHPREGVG